jgi:cullin-4
MDLEREKTMVIELLDFKDKMDSLVEKCCGNDTRFLQCVKDAFDVFINQRANKPAEMIGNWNIVFIHYTNKTTF